MVRKGLIAALAFWLGLTSPVFAETRYPREGDGSMGCGGVVRLYEVLAVRYGESLFEEYGDAEHDNLSWQLWVNQVTGTWTLIVVGGTTACLFSHGDDYLEDDTSNGVQRQGDFL